MAWNPVPGVPVVALAKAVLFAVIACAVCAVLGAGAGMWAGIEWQQGRQAQRDVAQALADTLALRQALEADRRHYIGAFQSAAVDLRAHTTRLETFAIAYEESREQNERHARELRATLEAELVRRPDLSAVRVGPGILCAWNRAAAGTAASGGAGAADADALPGCEPAAVLQQPGAGVRRRPADAAPQPAGRE